MMAFDLESFRIIERALDENDELRAELKAKDDYVMQLEAMVEELEAELEESR